MEEIALEPGERIVRKVRAHPLTLIGSLLPALILAVAPFALIFLIVTFSSFGSSLPMMHSIVDNISHSAWPRLALGLWWLFLWISAFNTITYYFLNVWVITTERIIDIHQPRYFSRKISSFFLSRVQDVTSDIHGILGTLFGFGFIHVETAGEEEDFEMHGIRDPQGLRDTILHEIDLVHRNHSGEGTDGV